MEDRLENQNLIEQLSEELSLKLASQLERDEISIEKMVSTIQEFLYKAANSEPIDKLENFIKELK